MMRERMALKEGRKILGNEWELDEQFLSSCFGEALPCIFQLSLYQVEVMTKGLVTTGISDMASPSGGICLDRAQSFTLLQTFAEADPAGACWGGGERGENRYGGKSKRRPVHEVED